jgi:integrase
MAKTRFTVGRVTGFECPKGKAQAFLWDAEAPGLGLRVTANGARAYVFQRPFAGTDVRLTIGNVDAWSIAAARKRAQRLQQFIDEGRDPRRVVAESVAADRAKRKGAITVADAWAVYLIEGKPRKKMAWKPRYLSDMRKAASPGGEPKGRGAGKTMPGHLWPLMGLPLSSLNRKVALAWLAREVKRSNVQAARATAMFSAFLLWVSNRPEFDGLVADPMCFRASVVGHLVTTPPSREDKLEGSQLPAFFAAIETLRERQPYGAALLVCLLLTGARREEMAPLKWADVDLRWRRMKIADKVGSHRMIPIAPRVEHELRALRREPGNPHVFVGPAGRIKEPRAFLDAVVEDAALPHLTPHGLRRSFATLGEEAGAPEGAIAQIMGHRASAIAERYKPRSLDRLAEILAGIEEYIVTKAGKPSEKGRAHGEGRLVVSTVQ